MKKSTLNQITNRCLTTLSKHPEYDYFPHWTFLLDEQKIVCSGMNRKMEPKINLGYHHNPDPLYKPKLHSELDVLRRCKENKIGLIAVNVRLNRFGCLRNSMPCDACQRLLHIFGIKRVYFSTEMGYELYILRK